MSSTATHKVRIDVGAVAMDAELNDTETARAIRDALPFGGQGNTWGDEIRPASPVTVVGRLLGNPLVFKQVPSGQEVTISSAP